MNFIELHLMKIRSRNLLLWGVLCCIILYCDKLDDFFHTREASPVPTSYTLVQQARDAQLALDSIIIQALPDNPPLNCEREIMDEYGLRWTVECREISLSETLALDLIYVLKRTLFTLNYDQSMDVIDNGAGERTYTLYLYKNGDKLARLNIISHPERKTTSITKIAIIIDDFGWSQNRTVTKLLDLPPPLNIAIIPHLEFSEAIAEAAHQKGHLVLLHMPMEPLDYPATKPGEGALMVGDKPEQMHEKINQALLSVPFAAGLNNHMGSRFTSDKASMITFLSLLQGRFFCDSYTFGSSLAKTLGDSLNISVLKRDLLIGANATLEELRKNNETLLKLAADNGYAIGQFHVSDNTFIALQELLANLPTQSIQQVSLSDLINKDEYIQ
jgi:uncharacterized protein